MFSRNILRAAKSKCNAPRFHFIKVRDGHIQLNCHLLNVNSFVELEYRRV